MAYTVTLLKHALASNERMVLYKVTADAASGAIQTPLGFLDAAMISPISMVTNACRVKVNLNNTSAAANGSVFLSSVTSGDDFFLTVYGRS